MKAGNLKISWRYSMRDPKVTACFIDNDDLPFPLAHGISTCVKGDQFNKETGRKLSLARAMKNANLPKEERKVIWELYRNMKPNKRW